ncbi:alpha-ketoglutarate-dependent dioxygenase AlkB family protein [Shewanella intestini]|uniref:Alpha-ketoglutarate-dependent dioxygenase AlkB n=1 Tax=Shewanella intestini TaxID=2017544 RepID=A0ABS5HZ72_9GAMM|nr:MULTISPECIES: alpha-ketoglutarate-dependent dioxygenase AlkB [Shewanella]MBR9726430.1 alpha-ketoglutarate-dependent dioxygenase AlkB [Shewanella intestini]MRG35004.1 alpha-ketoglutarate-dependent dioxygenase AlkB [Shewanella sp. XMDDZSB0408]
MINIEPPISIYKRFMTQQQCAALMDEVSSYPLARIAVQVYGKRHLIPRTQVWFGEAGCDYKYSNTLISPRMWPPVLRQVAQQFMAFEPNINAVLVNHYADGKECMGWHSDNEPEIVASSAIVSLSIGASRDFVIRHKVHKQSFKYLLSQGDVLVMPPLMQQQWQHALPKRLKVNKARVNFTFRHIKPHFYLK